MDRSMTLRRLAATVFALVLVAVSGPVTAKEEGYAERLARERQTVVQRLESYSQARRRSEAALAGAEKAVALAQELHDNQAAQIARRAKANAMSALARLDLLQRAETERLQRLDKRTSFLIDARRVDYVSRFKGAVSRTGGKELDAPLAPGDTITTGQDGFFEVSFLGGASMTLGPNTTLRLLDAQEVSYQHTRGRIYFLMRCAKTPEVCRYRRITPGVAIGVRGTAFETDVDDAGTTVVRTFEGKVTLTPARKGTPEEAVFAGSQATVSKDGKVLSRGKIAKAATAWWNF